MRSPICEMSATGAIVPVSSSAQSGRGVGRIAGGKIVSGNAAVGAQPALDVHQLRSALGLPGVLLLAGQLHPDRPADRARQQYRVGGDVVGAVAAVAAGGFHPDHVDVALRPLQQPGEVGAQQMRILRAGPNPHLTVPDIGYAAGRADRAVHLVRPDVGPRHRRGGGGEGGVDVALVDQRSRRRRIGAQRGRRCRRVRAASAPASSSPSAERRP